MYIIYSKYIKNILSYMKCRGIYIDIFCFIYSSKLFFYVYIKEKEMQFSGREFVLNMNK